MNKLFIKDLIGAALFAAAVVIPFAIYFYEVM
jgi:hypothetical protein